MNCQHDLAASIKSGEVTANGGSRLSRPLKHGRTAFRHGLMSTLTRHWRKLGRGFTGPRALYGVPVGFKDVIDTADIPRIRI